MTKTKANRGPGATTPTGRDPLDLDARAREVAAGLTKSQGYALELCCIRRGSMLATFDTDCIALRAHGLLVDASTSVTDLGRAVARVLAEGGAS